MPLDVATLTLRQRDVRAIASEELGTLWSYTTAHAHIDQQGYGKMDPSSPGKGLSTHSVASCLAVVMHCHTTKRTILTHSPNLLYMTTFIPMVDWITGGPDEPRYAPHPTAFQIMAFNTGRDADQVDRAPSPTTMDVAVFRGFEYADTALAATFGHDRWMVDFRGFFAQFSENRSIAVNILDSPQVLKYGSILVDKGTGKITLPVPHPDERRLPTAIMFEQSPAIPTTFTSPQKFQTLFVSNLLAARRQPEPSPIGMQFDGKQHTLPLPLTDEARQLLRAARHKEPASSQAAIIAAFQESDDWLRRPQRGEDHAVKMVFEFATRMPPCERCRADGKRACSSCKGAWYCGPAHQKEDWKAHKAWCKSHPYSSV